MPESLETNPFGSLVNTDGSGQDTTPVDTSDPSLWDSFTKQFKDSSGSIDWSKVLNGVIGTVGAVNAYQTAKDSGPKGFQGKVPKMTAVREQVQGPTTRTRPGAGGKRYFTDTSFANKATDPTAAQGIVTLAQKTAAQRDQLAAQNEARARGIVGLQPARPTAPSGQTPSGQPPAATPGPSSDVYKNVASGIAQMIANGDEEGARRGYNEFKSGYGVTDAAFAPYTANYGSLGASGASPEQIAVWASGKPPVQGAAQGGLMGYAAGGETQNPRYLRGNTDGMADEIPASIDGEQPAALAHGEFVIPADVVSHLGNGNSDAGAQQLYKMMDRIRMARTGTKKQGKEIDPEKFMAGGTAYAAGGTVQHFDAGGLTTTTVSGAPVSQESSLSNWAGEYVTDMLGKGQALADLPYAGYEGPLTAGDSPLQTQAFDYASKLKTPASIGQAATSLNDTATKFGNLQYTQPAAQAQAAQLGGPQQVSTSKFTQPGTADAYMSPYMQQVVQRQQEDAQRQADIAGTQRAGDLVKKGAFGGSRGAIMDAEAARNLARQKGDIQATGLQAAFQNAQTQFNADQTRDLTGQTANQGARTTYDTTQGQLTNATNLANAGAINQNNQFGANFGLSALQGQTAASTAAGNMGVAQNQAGLSNLNAQLNAGAVQQGTEQAGITADLAQFKEERDDPYKKLQFQQSLLSGMPLSTQTTTTQLNPLNSGLAAIGAVGSKP